MRSPSAAPTGGRSRVVSAVLGLLLLGSVAVIALDQTGRLGGPGGTGSVTVPPSTSPQATNPQSTEIAPPPTTPTAPAPGTSSGYGGLK